MSSKKESVRLKNEIQTYAWGSETAIPKLLAFSPTPNQPCAEYWMGVHPKAPSKACINGIQIPLNQLIRESPVLWLGPQVAERFGTLPYLFKVLSAERPLSIQVHPNREQAQAGFEAENQQGIPLTAPNRNYKDANHKPEILCALTSFWALRGFRSPAAIARWADRSGSPRLKGLSRGLTASGVSVSDALRGFLSALLQLTPTQKKELLDEVLRKTALRSHLWPVWKWVHRLAAQYPGDVGALAPLYLHLMHLRPGQAIYLGAGVLHAYLNGTGMELMANSDNVLRGGLTEKYMDVPALLQVVQWVSEKPKRIVPKREGCRLRYPTPSAEFELDAISVRGQAQLPGPVAPSVFIALKGSVRVGNTLLRKGESLLLAYREAGIALSGRGLLYRATVPQ